MADRERHESFEDTGMGIGQNSDGTFNIFPASELPARVEQRDRETAATTYAVQQSDEGFPEVEDLDDVSDLDDEE